MPTASAALERSLEVVHLIENDISHELPSYKHGGAPEAPARCNDPLPEVEKTFEQMHETVIDQRLKREDQGFFDRLVEGAKKGIKAIVGSQVESACNKFADNFPSLLECERLVGQFPCQLCCTNGRLSGSVMVSTNHLIFLGDDETCKVCMPMKNVVSYKMMSPTNLAPNDAQDYSTPVETLVSKADVKESDEIVEFFLRSDRVLVLQGVKNMRDFINIFDHIWRSCGPSVVRSMEEIRCGCECTDCRDQKCTAGNCAHTASKSCSTNCTCVECKNGRCATCIDGQCAAQKCEQCQCAECACGKCNACLTGKCERRALREQSIAVNDEDKEKMHREVQYQERQHFLPAKDANLRADAQCDRSSTTDLQCSKNLPAPEDQTCPGCQNGRCDLHKRSDWNKDPKASGKTMPNDSPHVM